MTKIKSTMLKRLLAFLCLQRTFFVKAVQDFETKVALLTSVEQEDPKCFAEGMVDLTCFWEEDGHRAPDQYTFTYKYQNENSSACAVASQPAGGGRTRYFCRLSRVKHFVSLDLQVFRNGTPLHNRSLSIDLVFLLDPPANLTVTRTGKKGQLRVRWLPPSLKHMTDSMMYEVSYALAGSRMGKVQRRCSHMGQVQRRCSHSRYSAGAVTWDRYSAGAVTWDRYSAGAVTAGTAQLQSQVQRRCSHMGQLEVVRGNTEFILHNLQAATRYDVRVRAKPDGLAYNGYWSAWTPSVSMETPPSDLDPLIIGLCLVISLILTLLSLSVFLSHRRFLWKMWPLIPSPEDQFPGLFTVYGGDFLEWLGQSNGWLQLRPGLFYQEAISDPLEVLSEASNGPLTPGRTQPPRASGLLRGVSEEEEEDEEDVKGVVRLGSSSTERWKSSSSHERGPADQLRTLQTQPVPSPWPSLLESKDAYVSLNQTSQPAGRDDVPPMPVMPGDVPEESCALSTTPGTPTSRSDLGSLRQSLGSGRLSSQSSLEYPQNSWLPKGPGYPYLAVADSGVSMDYSPVSSSATGSGGAGILYANEYKNIPQHKQHSNGEPIPSRC
ncbi:erythropoietin receptor-like isoform X1 [Anguilla anguilla]|uniref:erythropoietin receptor-like isoform X1 n=1 Tax=Anguilla anguilla TaxID=7936 RepID=UPI0015B1C601|nr:erythropoietin receptor-like isoform X1 [Anguilla anguilla]